MRTLGLFTQMQAQDIRNERRIFWSELVILLVVALLVAAYLAALWLTRPGASISLVSAMTSPLAIGRAVSMAL